MQLEKDLAQGGHAHRLEAHSSAANAKPAGNVNLSNQENSTTSCKNVSESDNEIAEKTAALGTKLGAQPQSQSDVKPPQSLMYRNHRNLRFPQLSPFLNHQCSLPVIPS